MHFASIVYEILDYILQHLEFKILSKESNKVLSKISIYYCISENENNCHLVLLNPSDNLRSQKRLQSSLHKPLLILYCYGWPMLLLGRSFFFFFFALLTQRPVCLGTEHLGTFLTLDNLFLIEKCGPRHLMALL